MKKKRLHEFSYVILFSRICHVGRYNARDRTNVSAATLAILVMSITESVRDKSQPFHPVFSCEHNDFFDFTSRVQPARYVLFKLMVIELFLFTTSRLFFVALSMNHNATFELSTSETLHATDLHQTELFVNFFLSTANNSIRNRCFVKTIQRCDLYLY